MAGGLGLGARLGVRVERAEAVAGAVRAPVLVHRHDDRVGFRSPAAGRLQALLPIVLLAALLVHTTTASKP